MSGSCIITCLVWSLIVGKIKRLLALIVCLSENEIYLIAKFLEFTYTHARKIIVMKSSQGKAVARILVLFRVNGLNEHH